MSFANCVVRNLLALACAFGIPSAVLALPVQLEFSGLLTWGTGRFGDPSWNGQIGSGSSAFSVVIVTDSSSLDHVNPGTNASVSVAGLGQHPNNRAFSGGSLHFTLDNPNSLLMFPGMIFCADDQFSGLLLCYEGFGTGSVDIDTGTTWVNTLMSQISIDPSLPQGFYYQAGISAGITAERQDTGSGPFIPTRRASLQGTFTVTVVPEPSSVLLSLAALASLALYTRRAARSTS